MSVTDYVIDILLILVIFRQVRPHELTPRAALLPLALLVAAGIIYLRPFTLRGNDLALILILAAAGLVLGGLSGLADRIWRDKRRRLMFRAGAISVITWVAGMGFRFSFAYYAYHSGGPAVARFSVRHDITGAGRDLGNRMSGGRCHHLCKQGVRGSVPFRSMALSARGGVCAFLPQPLTWATAAALQRTTPRWSRRGGRRCGHIPAHGWPMGHRDGYSFDVDLTDPDRRRRTVASI